MLNEVFDGELDRVGGRSRGKINFRNRAGEVRRSGQKEVKGWLLVSAYGRRHRYGEMDPARRHTPPHLCLLLFIHHWDMFNMHHNRAFLGGMVDFGRPYITSGG